MLEDPHLRPGLNVHRGGLTSRPVAESLGLPCSPIEQAFPPQLEPLLRSGSFFMDKSIWLIEVPQPKTHSLGLDESIASSPTDGSRGILLSQWANDRAGVHDVRRIKGGLDPAHRRDASEIAVSLQKVLLESTDAVLRAERAAERRGHAAIRHSEIIGTDREARQRA